MGITPLRRYYGPSHRRDGAGGRGLRVAIGVPNHVIDGREIDVHLSCILRFERSHLEIFCGAEHYVAQEPSASEFAMSDCGKRHMIGGTPPLVNQSSLHCATRQEAGDWLSQTDRSRDDHVQRLDQELMLSSQDSGLKGCWSVAVEHGHTTLGNDRPLVVLRIDKVNRHTRFRVAGSSRRIHARECRTLPFPPCFGNSAG